MSSFAGSSRELRLEIISKYPAKCYEIPPSEFGHGKTRNYGASKGTGEFILFVTQDAKPADEYWLENFIRHNASQKINSIYNEYTYRYSAKAYVLF